jgi:hypothetical protein
MKYMQSPRLAAPHNRRAHRETNAPAVPRFPAGGSRKDVSRSSASAADFPELSGRFDADQSFVSSLLPTFARPPGEQP